MPATLSFSGDESFDAPADRVYGLLTDAARMIEFMPDVASHEVIDAKTLRCVVRPGFSFLRGTMKMVIHIDELAAGREAKMTVDSEGIGVAMRIESTMLVEPVGERSRMRWSAEVTNMKGLVATLSPGLIKAAAEQVIRGTWDRVRARLAEG